jgi:Holliday junction resolvase
MPKRTGFSEKDLCTEIIKSLKQIGAFAFKVPDAAVSYQQTDASRTRFSLPRAVDIIAISQGRGYAIEVKLKRDLGTLKHADIRQEQRDTLERVWRAGGGACLAIGYRFKCGPNQRKAIGAAHARELYVVNWPTWQALESQEPQGVTRDALRRAGRPVQWLGGGLWDFDPAGNKP